ncbi:MAG: AI-2E family transporter [Crinalium sp.]
MPEPSEKIFIERLNNAKLLRYLLLFALGWAIVQVLVYFETVIIIFVLAAILAFLLNYPVQWLSRFLPRSIAVIVVFLLSLLIVGGLIVTLGLAILAQGQQLIEQAPELFQSFMPIVQQIEESLSRLNIQVNLTAIESEIRERALSGIGLGLTTLQRFLSNVIDLILIAVVALFMLLDGERLWNLFLKIFPKQGRDQITSTIKRNFLGFFWGRLILSVFFGVSCFVVFWILGAPYALLLAGIGGLFDLVPGIGATLGITLISLILLPQGIWLSLKVLIGCIILQQIEENLLMPRVMQGSINLNPVVMFFALLVGAKVAGLIGVFISIPIAGVIISLFEIEEMKGEQ